MKRAAGSGAVTAAIIEGPVSLDHPGFVGLRFLEIDSGSPAARRLRQRFEFPLPPKEQIYE